MLLESEEADGMLPLQPLMNEVFEGGGHEDADYRRPADPPLAGEEAEWADALLRAAGRR